MIVDVILHPRDLLPEHLEGRVVLVFDVLRATTTLTAALAAGATEIRTYDNLENAEAAAKAFDGPKLLCGERHTLPPPGFDLGNSPGDFTADRVGGKTIFFTTTNGTRAIHAALYHPGAKPKAVYAAALVNATAAAGAAVNAAADVTLLCSGSDDKFSAEDFYGAGAVIDALHAHRSPTSSTTSSTTSPPARALAAAPSVRVCSAVPPSEISKSKVSNIDPAPTCTALHAAIPDVGLEIKPGSDATLAARAAFIAIKGDLPGALRQTYGGQNNLRVGLAKDIDFAADLDRFAIVGVLSGDPATARILDR